VSSSQSISIEYNDHDITVELTANMVWDDYGVPGSPRWLTPTDITYSDYDVDGVSYSYKALVEFLGQDAVNEIDDMINSVSEDMEWEQEEPDYYDEDY
jgi:hypothetical protein